MLNTKLTPTTPTAAQKNKKIYTFHNKKSQQLNI
jgi:hypothetical protein